MALTNFNAAERRTNTAWSKTTWKRARNYSWMKPFVGKGHNSMIQRVDELTEKSFGSLLIIKLIQSLTGDGTVGDNQLEGREESLAYNEREVRIDQLRHAVRNEGKLANQKTVDNFRTDAREQLAVWLAERLDQLAILTASGIDYQFNNDGSLRPADSQFPNLVFNQDVTAPTPGRHRRWTAAGGGGLLAGDTSAIEATDKVNWNMLIDVKAYAKTHNIRGIKTDGKENIFHVFMTESGMADLWKDPEFISIMRTAGVRGDSNKLFKGYDSVLVNGMMIHAHNLIYNTTGADTGSKWGAASDVEGQRVLCCGAQALAFGDYHEPTWVEKGFDYENSQGISTGKMFGFKKPVFFDPKADRDEDFGIVVIDTAINPVSV